MEHSEEQLRYQVCAIHRDYVRLKLRTEPLKIWFSKNFWYNIYRKWNTLGVYSKSNLVNKKICKLFLSRFEPYKFMRLDTIDMMKS